MKRRIESIGMLSIALLLPGLAGYSQQHENHQQQEGQPKTGAATLQEEGHIFCPTMKTGQLCSHGTAANLRLSGEKQEQWVAMARKYNRAVNAATEELFRNAEVMLSSEQMALLKAWFAVGLNPEINQILYGKGLATLKVQDK